MNIIKAITEYKTTTKTLGEEADFYDIGSEERGRAMGSSNASLKLQETVLATWLHNNYEEIAKGENWNTQESCKVEFKDLPKENQKVMIELSKRILNSSF